MAVSSLLFKGVPSPLNLKILAACVVRDSSVENEAYLDTYNIFTFFGKAGEVL
jgi:hypothetical protein